MDNVFKFRDQLVQQYSSFSRSFAKIRAPDIREEVARQYEDGRYWPEPLIQINPNYARQGTVQQLAADGVLHSLCSDIFQVNKAEGTPQPLFLYVHQLQALAKGQGKQSFVVTTGTGSGKSLSFFIPIIDRILKAKELNSTKRTCAIVIYPMNALANSQLEELDKFLHGFPEGSKPFSVARYTGQESQSQRAAIAESPPDILLTNFMMLELILTRYDEVDRRVVGNCEALEFLVLDELHTYRGRQGADVALLVRRLRERLNANELVCIGTSATMSSTGSQADRNKTVADVASKLFGASITELDVIGETLERVTNPLLDDIAIQPYLRAAVLLERFDWLDFPAFQSDPLAVWVELNLGIELPDNEPPRRAKPKTLLEASKKLAQDAGCSEGVAKAGLQRFLVAAHEVRTTQGRPPFAFKLHQFISGPGKVLATIEEPGKRHITLDAQRFAPGRHADGVQLYSVHFCRDCGHEYHPVWQRKSGYEPREIDDISAIENEDDIFGFLSPSSSGQHYAGHLEELPDSWIDFSKDEPKIKTNYKKVIPIPVFVDEHGDEGSGNSFWFLPGKFRFCVNCGQFHDEVRGKDINRLASLSGEGRSSATTILSLSALRQLFNEPPPLPGQADPRKILGFTDNRQDAALQAGHFNDFVFLLTLRSGLIGALQNAGGMLDEEQLADAVFKSLGFASIDAGTLSEYLRNPKLIGIARQEAQRTLRFIIGYRLLRDLRRGWRFNNPNLDQLGLLAIRYRGIDEFCAESSLFDSNKILAALLPFERKQLCELLFDAMRRGLCLESRYLDAVEQDKARTNSYTYISERWAFAADEQLETARYLILSKRPEFRGKQHTDVVTGGPRTRLLRQIKMSPVWKRLGMAGLTSTWKDPEWVTLVESILAAGALYGYVQKHAIDTQLVGWRLNAAALDWHLTVDETADDEKANAFFRHLYLTNAELLRLPSHPLFEFEAQEHTAQVDAARRQLLEQRFRYTDKDKNEWASNPVHDAPLERLPVMFCSPTMELGVDISSLNTVYLRNVPPTPANYAQRSGRAGRSGQQALVVTYCAAQSPHDQWFFHNANEMVHGVVRPPSLDLTNRELVQSHLNAVWLAATQVALDSSIAPMLDLAQPDKPLLPEYHKSLSTPESQVRAQQSALRVINQLRNDLSDCGWFTDDFVQSTIEQAPQSFSMALERWRILFDATRQQMDMADQIVKSHTASHSERQNAQRRYGDAARQYAVLLKSGNTQNTDFYSYRYLASQGFLPGYNFPRLPLMAWIPARGGSGANSKDDEGSMVSRPRFLALSEFGPRSLIYHQGRMYRVVRAKLNVGSSDHISGSGQLATISSLVCSQCGYGHLGATDSEALLVNRCENCDALLTDHDWVRELYRIETVETVAVERISINDEDRQRQGFELQTTYRFLPGPDGRIQKRQSLVQAGDDTLASLTYAPAAQIWRINRGWRRRKNKQELGFYINPITGTWSKKSDPNKEEGEDNEQPLLEKVPDQRIVPFVEDHRNILILTPKEELSLEAMATLQAALKRGIEMTFQIEESELVAEPLPNADERRALLFYEAAEGGAGVLTRLACEPESLKQVASNALRMMHHNVPDGDWQLEKLPTLEQTDSLGNHICEAGCYQCLLSYFNQPDHPNINRRNLEALKLLVALANAQVGAAPENVVDELIPDGGDLAGEWLDVLKTSGLQLPDALHVPVNAGAAYAAGQYKAARALVFIEPLATGIEAQLVDKGWRVLDCSIPEQWTTVFAAYPDVFGVLENNK